MIQVAFITGRSDPSSCALSPLQQDFLSRLEGPIMRRHPTNFPYDTGPSAHRATLLPLAGLRNAGDYLVSRHARFAARHLGAVSALLGTVPHTILLAGSCGLELLVNLRLPVSTLERVSVFAYGPVARSLPACRCFLIQGQRDRLSRWFHTHVDQVVDCGHLDYLKSPAVLEACNAFIASKQGRPA